MTSKYLLSAVFLWAGLSMAPLTQGEDLVDIYESAARNDPQFQADRLLFQAEEQDAQTARSLLLPDFSFSAEQARRREELSSDGPFVTEGDATFNSTRYGFNLTQPVFDRFNMLTYKQAQLESERARLVFEQTKQQLILNVVNRYLTALAAQDNLDLTRAEKKAVFRQLELAQNRLDVGLGTITDLYNAEARFALIEASEIDDRKFLDDAYQALKELIGREVGELSILKLDSPLPKPNPEDIEYWVDSARQGNLDLLISVLDEEISRRELDRIKSQRLPTLDLVLEHNEIDDDGSISGADFRREGSEARLQLGIPLYQGGSISSSSRAALLRYQAAQKQTESAHRAIDRTVRSLFLDVSASISQVIALDQAITASENAMESTQLGFEAGLNTNLEVLDAQSDLFETKRDYLVARYAYIRDKLEFSEILGQLGPEDLEEVNAWLD